MLKIPFGSWFQTLRGEPGFLLLVMMTVPVLFSTLPDKKVASVLAGSLFLISGLLVLRQSLVRKNFPLKIISIIFLVGFSLPILGLRLFNWESDFSQLSLFGISGQWLHEASTWVFLTMLGFSIGVNWIRRVPK